MRTFFLSTKKKCGSRNNIQYAGAISPSAPAELSIEHSAGAASGFQPMAYIKPIKKCADILRTIHTKKNLAQSE